MTKIKPDVAARGAFCRWGLSKPGNQ